jgi:autotransporter-associated beta strand protein
LTGANGTVNNLTVTAGSGGNTPSGASATNNSGGGGSGAQGSLRDSNLTVMGNIVVTGGSAGGKGGAYSNSRAQGAPASILNTSLTLGAPTSTFTVTANGNGATVQLNDFNMNGNSVTVANTGTFTIERILGFNDSTFALTGNVTVQSFDGAGALSKTGTGTLIVAGESNTFSGDLNVGGGIVQLNTTGKLGDANVSINTGGTLQLFDPASLANGTYRLNGGTLQLMTDAIN